MNSLDEPGHGGIAGDADGIAGDAGGIAGDAGGIAGDAGGLLGAVWAGVFSGGGIVDDFAGVVYTFLQ